MVGGAVEINSDAIAQACARLVGGHPHLVVGVEGRTQGATPKGRTTTEPPSYDGRERTRPRDQGAAEVGLSAFAAFPIGSTFSRFFRERGTHLAAMVAYFALLSFVPLVFLVLAGLGLIGQVDASSALVSYLEDIFPGQSVEQIVSVVRAVQRNAGTLSIIGGVGLAWSSLSLFSALESAFNVIYGRPNRSFLRGKALAVVYMGASLLVLFAGLIAGTFGYNLLRRYEPAVFGNRWVALALTVSFSALALFLFLLSVYYRLTNARLTRREMLPGAIIGAFFLELTLQLLPLFVFVTSDVVALQALGTTFLLLIWFYVMANVILFGAALNYEIAYGRTGRTPRPKQAEKPTPGIANDTGAPAEHGGAERVGRSER